MDARTWLDGRFSEIDARLRKEAKSLEQLRLLCSLFGITGGAVDDLAREYGMLPRPEDPLRTSDFDDLRFSAFPHRASGGLLVRGAVAGYWFEALVLNNSCIVKLYIRRETGNRERVYCWERGPICPATTPNAQQVVDFLCDWLHNLARSQA